MSLPKPGEIVTRDFRPATQPPPSADNHKQLRIVTWNIERGYELPGIIEELKQIDADIIALQEVDIGCDRSKCVNTGEEIARQLGMNYVFFTEFEELRSDVRDSRTQGGGVHGNAILTKFDIVESSLVKHKSHPIDWNNQQHPLARKEPRKGERAVLRCVIDIPNDQKPQLVVYCAHFEVFCGMLSRIEHLADIFADARQMIDGKGYRNVAICGDMNTMAHGIARLSREFCTDKMRFLSLGNDEAMMWNKYILPVKDPRYDPMASHSKPEENADGKESFQESTTTVFNAKLLHWGLDTETAINAVNPYFEDPFPPEVATLDHPAYKLFGYSFMKGKLDWLLLRAMAVVDKSVGNDDYSLSDHKWLSADVVLQ